MPIASPRSRFVLCNIHASFWFPSTLFETHRQNFCSRVCRAGGGAQTFLRCWRNWQGNVSFSVVFEYRIHWCLTMHFFPSDPPFMYLGCSDSRYSRSFSLVSSNWSVACSIGVSEGTVFSAKPGTFFAERNIANQFSETDPNACEFHRAPFLLAQWHIWIHCSGTLSSYMPSWTWM